jgi:hypothetical protein
MKVPKYVYHASAECVHDSIVLKGLVSSWEGVYAASSPDDALRFMSMRLLAHYHGSREGEYDGNTILIPDIVLHDYIEVWKIDTTKCPKKWVEGTDHSTAVFGNATSWLHPGDIPLSAVVSYNQYKPREES